MESCLPSLTPDGFIRNKRMIFYKLWEYFLTSEYSQSNVYYTKIASLKYALTSFPTAVRLVAATEEMLKTMYENYFDNVTVDCFIINPEDAWQILSISITCYDNEKPDIKYTLVKDIKHQKGEIHKYEELLQELYRHYI